MDAEKKKDDPQTGWEDDEPDCSLFSCIPKRCSAHMGERCVQITQMLNLTVLTMASCLLGFGIGAALQTTYVSPLAIELIRYPGEIFIRALKLIVLPLIFSTIIAVPSTIGDGPGASKLGSRAIGYYVLTSLIGACEGLIWVNVFKPGVGVELNWQQMNDIPEPRGIAFDEGTDFGFINFGDKSVDWASAVELASGNNGFLPSLASLDDAKFLTKIAGEDHVWLGMNSTNGCDTWNDGSANNLGGSCPSKEKCLRTDKKDVVKFDDCTKTFAFLTQFDCTNYLSGCDGQYAPFCGERNGVSVTFSNQCLLREAMCLNKDDEWSTTHPGICVDNIGVSLPNTSKETVDAFLDIGRSAIDSNLVQGLYNLNILGIVVFAFVFGLYLRSHERRKSIIDLAETTKEVCMKIIGLIIMFTPIGMLSLVTAEIARMDNIIPLLRGLGIYIGTFCFAIFLHIFLVYPIVFFFYTHGWSSRLNPYAYMWKIKQAPMTAFATSSSAATMPVTLRVNKQAGVSHETAEFVIPLGTTINMDGTSIGYPLSVIFLAQLIGIPLTPGNQIVIAILATVISVGAAPVPSAGMVYLILIMDAVDIPIEGAIGFLFTIDWLIDRIETATNVFGDSLGSKAIDVAHERYMKKFDGDYDSVGHRDNGDIEAGVLEAGAGNDVELQNTTARDSDDDETSM